MYSKSSRIPMWLWAGVAFFIFFLSFISDKFRLLFFMKLPRRDTQRKPFWKQREREREREREMSVVGWEWRSGNEGKLGHDS